MDPFARRAKTVVNYANAQNSDDSNSEDENFQLPKANKKKRPGLTNAEQCAMAGRIKPIQGDYSRCYLCGGLFTSNSGMSQCGPQCEHILEFDEDNPYGSYQQHLIPGFNIVNNMFRLNFQWAHRFCNNAKQAVRAGRTPIVRLADNVWEIDESGLAHLKRLIEDKMRHKSECSSVLPPFANNWDNSRFFAALVNLLNLPLIPTMPNLLHASTSELLTPSHVIDPGQARGGKMVSSSRATMINTQRKNPKKFNEIEKVNEYIKNIVKSQLFIEMKSSDIKTVELKNMMAWFNNTTDYMTTLDIKAIKTFNIVKHYIRSISTSKNKTATARTNKIKILYYIIIYLQLGIAYGHLNLLKSKKNIKFNSV